MPGERSKTAVSCPRFRIFCICFEFLSCSSLSVRIRRVGRVLGRGAAGQGAAAPQQPRQEVRRQRRGGDRGRPGPQHDHRVGLGAGNLSALERLRGQPVVDGPRRGRPRLLLPRRLRQGGYGGRGVGGHTHTHARSHSQSNLPLVSGVYSAHAQIIPGGG